MKLMRERNNTTNFGFEQSRRSLLQAGAAVVAAIGLPMTATSQQLNKAGTDVSPHNHIGEQHMNTITLKDGASIYYKDWGAGQPIVFSHGWPLNADAWDPQMMFLGQHGYRVITHDRRSHGRSSQTWDGNDMNTYADDLAELFERLDLKKAIMVGHSTGGGEVARYIGRHGTKRVAKAVLISSVVPIMVQSAARPNGVPIEVLDGIRRGTVADRPQYLKDFSTAFYGYNRPGAKISEGVRENFALQGLQAGIKGLYDCVGAFSETDFTEDLRKIDVPTLVMHGDADQIVPFPISGQLTAKIVKNATLKVYPGYPHGMCTTEADTINKDLLEFIRS
jgi:non-heme chloroperoxidase